jgi:hypothetical protein
MKITVKNSRKILAPLTGVMLYAVYPVLALYAHNAEELALRQLVLPLFSSMAAAALLFYLWRILLKDSYKAGLATVAFLILSWNYGLIYAGMTSLVNLHHWHVLPVVLFLYFHLVYFIARAKHEQTLVKSTTILLVPIALLVFFNIITIFPSESRKYKAPGKKKYASPPVLNETGNGYPDIFMIILDEYASLRTIKEEWGYDNHGFADFLRSKGFFVAGNSETRYSQTEWNLASLLNLDYLTGPVAQTTFLDYIYDAGSIKGTEGYNMLKKITFQERIQKMNDNFLADYLKKHGYKIAVLEGMSQFYASIDPQNLDVYYSYQKNNRSEYLLHDPFYMELIKKTIIFPFDMFIKTDHAGTMNYQGTRYVFNFLEEQVQKLPLKSPKFIYAHILCPHTPYVFARDGKYVPPVNADEQLDGKFVSARNTVNAAYLEQYIYVTNEIKKIAAIHLRDRSRAGPVFIIQSDHGPRPHDVYLKDRTNSFRVFNAVYFPDGDYRGLYDTICPVNTLRVVLNKYFRENLLMLEDK